MMPDKYGVFKYKDKWYWRHYATNSKNTSAPYTHKINAMKALLNELGFEVEDGE